MHSQVTIEEKPKRGIIMSRIDFNGGWRVSRLGSGEWKEVTLPHDAMIGEKRSIESAAGVNTGWILADDYEYEKSFFLPAEYEDKALTLEFEGVYRNAEVYLNGEKVACRPYGYTNFYVPLKNVVFGGENTVRVVAYNSDQPNSRWYSGTGIYRPVVLHVQPRKHILLNGIKLRTLGIDPAVEEIVVRTNGNGNVTASIERDGKLIITETRPLKEGVARFELPIEQAKLWTPGTPELYLCRVCYDGEEETVSFGVRTQACDREHGFMLNGERVIIRGACIHHDNGILGARCYAEAEERKIKKLKEVGYNAIRSAHNPCSKAMLDACDRLGMMVMDEYVDMWYIHKNRYDYADYIMDWYEQDIADMIDKDYNHPCVIMYSLGNEVAETGQKRGIEFFSKMRSVCKRLDPERPVTTGVNIFFNYLYSLGFGVYSDKKAEENPTKKVGSEFFNDLAGLTGDGFMKTMAMLPGCDRKTRDCYAAMDVAGYNYGIKRYRGDLKKYPDRIILGSETFCSDAYAFYEIAKKETGIIGDFVWAGMDYLGEVGIGSWEYREYAPDFRHGPGWVSAGSGRLDLNGDPLGEALYTKVAFELEDRPQIAVVPVSHTKEKHSPSAWKFSNALPTWSWNGLDGKRAKVEVYSRAPIIELQLNGKRVGRKKFRKNCRFDFKIKYFGGELTAIAYDQDGNETGRNSLITADDETKLSVIPEKSVVTKGEVCFVPISYTDGKGVWKPLGQGNVKVSVSGGELLALGHACPYNEDGYLSDTTKMYYGRALAVVRADEDSVTIKASDGMNTATATIVTE